MPLTLSGLYVPPGGAPEAGYQAALTIGNPSAGTLLAYKVGGSFYEEVLNFKANFTTDGNVATRGVSCNVQDSNGVLISAFGAAGSQHATDNWFYNFSVATPTPTVDSVSKVISGPAPPFILMPNWTLTMGVTGIQAGDQFSEAYVTVNRIPTGIAATPRLSLVPTPLIA